MKTGLEKETTTFRSFHVKWLNGYLAWMLVSVQMNHGSSSAHVQWFSHQNGGAYIRDII